MLRSIIAIVASIVLIFGFEVWIRWLDREIHYGVFVPLMTKVKTPPAVLRARAAKRGLRGKDGR